MAGTVVALKFRENNKSALALERFSSIFLARANFISLPNLQQWPDGFGRVLVYVFIPPMHHSTYRINIIIV